MKVKTDLKSGNLIDSIGQYANQLGTKVLDFFNTAQNQAEGVIAPVYDKLVK